MKKLHVLLAAALLVALAPSAHAQGTFQILAKKLQFQSAQTSAGKDTSSLVGMTTTTALTAAKDTTLWEPLTDKKFSQPGFSAAPVLQATISSSGTTDSVGYQIQYAADAGDPTMLWTTTQAYLVFGSDTQKQLDVILPNAAGATALRYRIILWANDTGGVVHTYRVSEIWRGTP